MAAPKPMERKFLHRILLVACGFSLLFGIIYARLYFLQITRHEFYYKKAVNRHAKTIKITPQRGSIFSSEGRSLATSTFQETAYLAPRYFAKELQEVQFRNRLAREIARAIGLQPALVNEKLKGGHDQVLKRKLSEKEVQQLVTLREEFDLPKPSLYFVKEGERHYPQKTRASHVIGFTERDNFGDNRGIAGAEAAFNHLIAGKGTTETVEVSVGGQSLSPIEEEAMINACGNDVYLTINENIQHYAETALQETAEKYKARGAICIAMEVQTGAIVAMASYPTFDINERSKSPSLHRKNKCVVDAISPGSVMKVFTSTLLLETNKMSPHEYIDCELGFWQIGRRRIKDAHKMGLVPVHEVFAESSNIGFVKLGLRLSRTEAEKAEYYRMLRNLGFGSRTRIELPEEGPGFMFPLEKWNPASLVSLPIGYEIMISPVQVISAMAAIANKGIYMQPHLLKEVRTPRGDIIKYEPKPVRQVCKPQTSEIVIKLMEEVVTSGTGESARVPGYRVGGKTGTTVKDDKVEEGQDQSRKRYYASFIGLIPANAPRLAIYAWVDEPQGAKYGGEVAAPIFQVVASNAVRILGIPSTEPILEKKKAPGSFPVEDVLEDLPPAAPALPPLVEMGPTMPDLRGMTIRETLPLLNAAKIDAELAGWGVCSQQQPQPGECLALNTRALVVFTPPNPTPVPASLEETTHALQNNTLAIKGN